MNRFIAVPPCIASFPARSGWRPISSIRSSRRSTLSTVLGENPSMLTAPMMRSPLPSPEASCSTCSTILWPRQPSCRILRPFRRLLDAGGRSRRPGCATPQIWLPAAIQRAPPWTRCRRLRARPPDRRLGRAAQRVIALPPPRPRPLGVLKTVEERLLPCGHEDRAERPPAHPLGQDDVTPRVRDEAYSAE